MPKVFLPPETKRGCDVCAHCSWCVREARRREFFRIRDGPVDYYFCNIMHAELWLEYRQKPETRNLCRMLPPERREYLGNSTMEQEISRLFPERCALNQLSPP